MAYSLKKLGFTDVTILERSNRIGGKGEHFQYRGIKHPMSILLWTSAYKTTLEPLLQQFGFLEQEARSDRFSFLLSNELPSVEASEYVILWVMKNLNITYPNMARLRILQDLDKYTDIHQDLFGTYKYGLMKRAHKQINFLFYTYLIELHR